MSVLKSKKILLVDDEKDLLDIFAEVFADEGAIVLTSCDVKEAYLKLNTNAVDLVITDIVMPGFSGIELLKTIRKTLPPRLPVLFVSGDSNFSDEMAWTAGAQLVLRKPFAVDDLLDCARRAIEGAQFSWGSRRHPRLSIADDLFFKFDSYPDARSSQLVNIGCGGAYVKLSGRCPRKGSIVRFSILFEAEQPTLKIEGAGIVRWTDEAAGGLGIEFMEFDQANIHALEELLTRYPSFAYIPIPRAQGL